MAKQVLGLLSGKKQEKLLHLGPEIKSHDAVKTGLNLRRQWSVMSK